MNATLPLLEKTLFPALKRGRLDTLQVNLGYRCNQSCLHCHVNAGPNRTEMMDDATLALIPQVLAARGIRTLDLTGGAPELHEGFRDLVRAARAQGVRVIDRCNLTILFEPGQDGLAEFLAGQQVEVVASLPCYSAANVDRQRGDGVFDKSIAALQQLNALGYGQPGSGRVLNLVYNPQGAVAAARPAGAAGRLQARAVSALRHRLQRAAGADQHADPALRLHAGLQGQLRRLHGPAQGQLPAAEPGRRDVPQPGQRGLAGLALRLRLQPAARSAAGHQRRAPPSARPAQDRPAGAADPRGRPLLRLHRRARAAAAAVRWRTERACPKEPRR